MLFYCLEDFKSEFDKLKKNNSYRDLESDLCKFLFSEDKELNSFKKIGSNLNNNLQVPYIKCRIKGSGGYRIYFLLIVKDERLFLLFVHPKTGAMGATNITTDFKKGLYNKAVNEIESGQYCSVTKNAETGGLVFTPLLY